MDQKMYGLIRLSKQNKPTNTLMKNIFDSDSDEELETNAAPKRVVTTSGVKRQTQLDISRAITEDPDVFEYDSIYDEMKSKNETKDSKDTEMTEKPKQRPKYINNLLKFSENRKKENERRVERKIQKERESEGNEFKDKEEFVTNAYKEKLEEMRAADEKDRKEKAIEELLDVKKQKDLSGFYRHLFNNDMSSQSVDELPKDIPNDVSKSIPKPKTNRQFRRRKSSSEESEEESQRVETNVETIEKLDEKEDKNKVKAKERHERQLSLSKSEEINESIDENQSLKQLKPKIKFKINEEIVKNNEKTVEKVDKRELLLKLFTKRTVGQVFTDKQMKYFERKDKYII